MPARPRFTTFDKQTSLAGRDRLGFAPLQLDATERYRALGRMAQRLFYVEQRLAKAVRMLVL